MRIRVSQHLDSNIDLSSARQFKIKASAHAFKLLVDQYHNPILATVREIITNAVDIHIRTKQTRPIEVEAPTLFNNFMFTVRDFGTGLTDEEIDTYYATFFSSDKNNTDDETGGLGLGCKCPLTYTDQFTVESRQNGRQTTYSIFVAADGIPHVMQQSSIEYIGPDGLTVQIPCSSDDEAMFHKWIAHSISYAGEHYFEHNVHSIPKREIWFTSEHNNDISVNFLLGECRKAAVVMGGVHYTVPLDTFTWNLRKYLEEFNTEIVAPIGSFEIHPSRESLIFRTETVKRLTTLYTTALENLLSQYNNILEVQPTFAKAIELTRAVHAGISYLRRNLSFHDPIVWCGIDLEKVALPETIGVKSIKIQHWRRQNLVKFDKIYEKGSEATIDLLETLPKSDKFIFLNGRISIKQYAIDNKLTEHGGLVFTGDFEDAKWFVEDLLGYELIVLNRAPKKQNASVSRTPQTISSTYEYTCFGTEIGEASLSAESLCELRDAGVVFIRCSSIDDVEKQAEKLTSWLNLKLLALHREIVFVYMPESHKRIRQQFRFQALSDVLTDSILVTRNARQLAMYAALRKVHADYTTPASWLIGHLNEINEEDAWMLERAQAVECFRQEASNTFPPVPIVADDSWMEYYIEVNAHAQRVLRKYTDLIDVLSELWSHQAEPRRKKIIQWYIGANS